MKKIINQPDNYIKEMLEGIYIAHKDMVTCTDGDLQCLVSKYKKEGKVEAVAEENKTQVAVNNEGKTNEATKNIKEPLKSAQENPDNKKQQEKPKAPAKSKGRKI